MLGQYIWSSQTHSPELRRLWDSVQQLRLNLTGHKSAELDFRALATVLRCRKFAHSRADLALLASYRSLSVQKAVRFRSRAKGSVYSR